MKLNPCPFCPDGGEPDMHKQPASHEFRLYFYVRCLFCGATGPKASDEEMAARLWNRYVLDAEDRPILQQYTPRC